MSRQKRKGHERLGLVYDSALSQIVNRLLTWRTPHRDRSLYLTVHCMFAVGARGRTCPSLTTRGREIAPICVIPLVAVALTAYGLVWSGLQPPYGQVFPMSRSLTTRAVLLLGRDLAIALPPPRTL